MYEKKQLSFEQVKDKALRLLEYRNQSEHELRQKLIRAGGSPDDIDSVLEFCKEYGFVNDMHYAKALAKDLSNLKKFGKHRIRQELCKRGIDPEYMEQALDDVEDSLDTLESMLQKKLKGNYEKNNCDKAIRYFIYRGYELRDIKNAIERLKTDEF